MLFVKVYLSSSGFDLSYFLTSGLSGEGWLAQSYSLNHSVTYSTGHTYFNQLPLMLYFLYTLAGIPMKISELIMNFVYLGLLAFSATYIIKLARIRCRKGIVATLIPSIGFMIVAFFIFTSMTVYFFYFAIPLFYFLIGNFYKEAQGTNDLILCILLTIGITIGSPRVAMLVIPFFIIYGLLKASANSYF